jgi:hypothetical protein
LRIFYGSKTKKLIVSFSVGQKMNFLLRENSLLTQGIYYKSLLGKRKIIKEAIYSKICNIIFFVDQFFISFICKKYQV